MSNNDPLVEAVARAIARQRWTDEAADPNLIDDEVEYGWNLYGAEARAAIKAVLEWYSKVENVGDEMVQSAEDANVDNVGRCAIAAAMSAELQRREG